MNRTYSRTKSTDMTDDQIIHTIAEDRGWTFQPQTGPLSQPWVGPSKTWDDRASSLPPYLTDHNAAHELIQVLRGEGWFVGIEFPLSGNFRCRIECQKWPATHKAFTDTFPRAVAECYLKVRGKWQH